MPSVADERPLTCLVCQCHPTSTSWNPTTQPATPSHRHSRGCVGSRWPGKTHNVGRGELRFTQVACSHRFFPIEIHIEWWIHLFHLQVGKIAEAKLLGPIWLKVEHKNPLSDLPRGCSHKLTKLQIVVGDRFNQPESYGNHMGNGWVGLYNSNNFVQMKLKLATISSNPILPR